MEFEHNPNKSAANKAKHGIDFEEAQALWQDVDRLEIPARFYGEDRIALIGRIPEKLWTAIFTMRDGAVRLISCRRAREEEAVLYERAKNEQH